MQPTIIGLDLGKNVFQVHGVSAAGEVVLRRKLRRSEVAEFFAGINPCLVGLEACFSAHHWARELTARGHQVKLMPPSYVKPYVKRGKNDAVDAEAICEAVTRPTMRFVPIKSAEQQSILMLHRIREQFVRQRTSLFNSLRSHLSEVGIVAPPGVKRIPELLVLVEDHREQLPRLVLSALTSLLRQLQELKDRIEEVEKEIFGWAKTNDAARRLATIPGIGPVTAAAIAATVADPKNFKSGRQFAAWIGLVPRQNSSGGKDRLGSISKMGDRYLRKLLVIGATTIIRYAKTRGGPRMAWVAGLLERRPPRLVTVAIANKTARIAWAVMTRGETYRPGIGGAI